HVGVVEGEPEVPVHLHGGIVVGLDVEHHLTQAASAQVTQAGGGEDGAEAAATSGGIYAQHVHLADRLLVLVTGVHLGPVVTQQPLLPVGRVFYGEQEALRVPPRLALAEPQLLDVPATLLRVPAEGGVV